MGRDIARVGCILTLCLFFTAPAWGQTRAEEIAQRQAEKARTVEPYTPNQVEKFFERIQGWSSGVGRGWYPAFGAVYPTGGLTFGGGYRHYIGYDSFVDAGALYSIRGYKKIQITGNTPDHLGGRLNLEGSVGWLDATEIPFFGLGIDSDPVAETNFRLNRAYMLGAAELRLVDWLRLRLDGGLDDYTQKAGLGPTPSIEARFTPATTPLLGESRLYLRGELSATVYWLDAPEYSRRGGFYRFAYEEFNPLDREGDTFGFVRTEIVQHIPILRETWVVSLRARAESIARESDAVPFFLMPGLGGGATLRAYETGRFRDRHAMLVTGEFRWFPNRLGLDMALFYDAGQVAPSLRRLTLDNMKTDYGIGVRFHSLTRTLLRLDLARGDEGWRVVLSTHAAF